MGKRNRGVEVFGRRGDEEKAGKFERCGGINTPGKFSPENFDRTGPADYLGGENFDRIGPADDSPLKTSWGVTTSDYENKKKAEGSV